MRRTPIKTGTQLIFPVLPIGDFFCVFLRYQIVINCVFSYFNWVITQIRSLIKVLFGRKKLTLLGFEPGTDGFQAHHRNHCSISIWMNAGGFPKVLYFPITNLTVGVLLKARLLLLENIIVNQKYQHDRIPRLTCSNVPMMTNTAQNLSEQNVETYTI